MRARTLIPILTVALLLATVQIASAQAGGDPEHGGELYVENCAVCHGDRGEGRFGLPLAKVWAVVNPPAYIHQVVSQGIQGSTMPAWARPNGGPLEDKEIADVTAFLLSLEPASVPTPVAGPSAGPMGSTATLILLAVLAAVLIVILVVYYRRARPD
jgi:mono/diheme cytochrome c family protein